MSNKISLLKRCKINKLLKLEKSYSRILNDAGLNLTQDTKNDYFDKWSKICQKLYVLDPTITLYNDQYQQLITSNNVASNKLKELTQQNKELIDRNNDLINQINMLNKPLLKPFSEILNIWEIDKHNAKDSDIISINILTIDSEVSIINLPKSQPYTELDLIKEYIEAYNNYLLPQSKYKCPKSLNELVKNDVK